MIEVNGKYRQLLRKIIRLGVVVPGTIREVYLKCGKVNCCCREGAQKNLHGPYYFWDRKINGRLSSLSIAKKDLPIYERYIGNRKALEGIIAEMLETGCSLLTNLEKNVTGKSKKSTASTRGK